MINRASGVLLHISSLPGPYGIGAMGRYSKGFVDFLKKSGQNIGKYFRLVLQAMAILLIRLFLPLLGIHLSLILNNS